ncbi:HNH endonuclease [Sphingobacterium faecium]|uniref:HNH endonuclease n=1 Tax=Sphingobacterium faecium TaxID=34087 RepID=UPI0012918DB8|nr:HNH endonuclease [Sphingobacterium faecium]MQP30068.1 HNH endonuclease [Sphingobacterium faecium]
MAIVYTIKENADIAAAIAQGGKIWSNVLLNDVKTKIKNHYFLVQFPRCCYCSRLFVGEFRMVVDIEHILPQSQFGSERFVPDNLNIACKRCNMEIKKADLSFIVDIVAMGTDYYNSIHYKIVHPNLDIYDNHLVRKEYRTNNFALVKYSWSNNDKGLFTYKYFKLNELEIDALNNAQGLPGQNNFINSITNRVRHKLIKMLMNI